MPEADFSFSNPSAPAGFHDDGDHEGSANPLSNADFRKLLMTPGARRTTSGSMGGGVGTDANRKKSDKKKGGDDSSAGVDGGMGGAGGDGEGEEKQSRWERRKKRKQYFAKLLKQQQEREEELSQKYRDRARERRDGKVDETDESELLQTSADYRAVAPDSTAFKTAADRRKQAIENSKYLGGDMEHTHLVKGLDFALLQKVRAEIDTKEAEEQQLDSYVASSAPQNEKEEHVAPQFSTVLGRNIYNVITRKYPERNENFFQGRMFYRVDLEDDPTDSLATDIPTAILRSKADCPVKESQLKDATNDMVIGHLAQILSYLRHGDKHRKGKRRLGAGAGNEKGQGANNDRDYHSRGDYHKQSRDHKTDTIFDDVNDYDPKTSSSNRKHHSDHRDNYGRSRNETRRDDHRSRNGESSRHHGHGQSHSSRDTAAGSYFDKPAERLITDDGWSQSIDKKREQFRKRAGEQAADDSISTAKKVAEELEKRPANKVVPDGYFECYPDAAGFAGGLDDSDDDIDWTKMDMGNKKGPMGRWDFETQEEYSNYMSSKEALPKAAFQFGVKMNDGRKTRKQHVGPKDEKKALDREWEQISKIIDRRKGGGAN